MKLGLVHPEIQIKLKPEVEFSLNKNILEVAFDVTSPEDFNVNPALSKTESIWGLWDFDVVEVFIQPDFANPTYYEFIVSPLNQYFELEIFKPRVDFNKNFTSGFTHLTTQNGNRSFGVEMKIPLEKLGWKGDPKTICGNAFSILGKKTRTYWSAFLPKQEKPDFHIPSFFKPVL